MRIGLIGAGTMARVHSEAISKIAGAEVVAFAAPAVPEATLELAQRLGASVLPSAHELLARPEIDLVVVAVPTDLHPELVLAAARAGKQIICEKPLARTLAGGEAMIEAADRAGVKLGVGHVVRYFPEYAAARRMVLAGEVGTPGVARATRGVGFPRAAPWYADLGRSGGVALDLMIHDFDWMRWTFGPVERLFARGLAHSGRAGTDGAMATLRFRSGALGYVEGSWAYPGGFRTTLEVSGSGGLIQTGSAASEPFKLDMLPAGGERPELDLPTGGLTEDPYLIQMRDLLGWMAGGPAPRCNANDAFEALRLSLAALDSIGSGRPVVLEASE